MPEASRSEYHKHDESSEHPHRQKRHAGLEAPPELRANVPYFDRDSGPTLSAETTDEFFLWAAGVPNSEVDVIRRRIASARDDEKLLDRLLEHLWELPVRDVSRHRLILSTIGELRNPRAAQSLVKFIWYDGDIAVRDDRERFLQSCSFETDGADMLRARAAEMLSYLGSREAAEATLDIAARHPNEFVRAAAIDAHMFNAGDSPETAEHLRRVLQKDDHWRIGLPRLTRTSDPREFEQAVLAFYERYPEERPPVPEHRRQPGPTQRAWYSSRPEKEA